MNTQAQLVFVAGSLLPSFLVALLATYVVRASAARFGLIDLPSERKVHTTPTPHGGGLAVWFGVVGTFVAAQLVLWYVQASGGESLSAFLASVASSASLIRTGAASAVRLARRRRTASLSARPVWASSRPLAGSP